MNAKFPPFTKPAEEVASRRIDEREAYARTAMSYLHHAQELLKKAFPDASSKTSQTAKAIHDQKLAEDVLFDTQCGHEQPLPAESAYLASFSPNPHIGSSLDDFMAETLRESGIGDVPHTRHSSLNVSDVGHPLHHVVLGERTPGDRP